MQLQMRRGPQRHDQPLGAERKQYAGPGCAEMIVLQGDEASLCRVAAERTNSDGLAAEAGIAGSDRQNRAAVPSAERGGTLLAADVDILRL